MRAQSGAEDDQEAQTKVAALRDASRTPLTANRFKETTVGRGLWAPSQLTEHECAGCTDEKLKPSTAVSRSHHHLPHCRHKQEPRDMFSSECGARATGLRSIAFLKPGALAPAHPSNRRIMTSWGIALSSLHAEHDWPFLGLGAMRIHAAQHGRRWTAGSGGGAASRAA